jgi:hypothetical protein
MRAGRPAKYDTKFHPQDCIRLGKQGLIKKHMAREWKIGYDTITRWCKIHPEFKLAFQLASCYRYLIKKGDLEQQVREKGIC